MGAPKTKLIQIGEVSPVLLGPRVAQGLPRRPGERGGGGTGKGLLAVSHCKLAELEAEIIRVQGRKLHVKNIR